MNVQSYVPEDQASRLRTLAQPTDHRPAPVTASQHTRVLAVASGKGGVGKTNLAVNLGLAMAEGGKRVWLLDADMGLANVDVVMGLQPRYTLGHVLSGEKRLDEIIVTGPWGLRIIPGASGLANVADLPLPAQDRLLRQVVILDDQPDVLLLDTGAGIGANVLRFLQAAQEIIIVVTPEPTAITDAYALVKVLGHTSTSAKLNLVVNWARNQGEAEITARKLAGVIHQFLKVDVNVLGSLPDDKHLAHAVRQQKPVLLAYPHSPYAAHLRRLGQQLGAHPPATTGTPSTLRNFFQRLAGRSWPKVLAA